MQRTAWARWRSRVYVTPDVFRIALSKFHPIFAQIGHLPQNLQQTYEILSMGPKRTRPSCGTPTRGDPDTPQVPDHPQVPNPLSCTEVTMGPKNTGRRRRREERGPAGWDPSRVPCEARPSLARWRHPAGVTARRLVTKVKTPFFNDLRTMTSLYSPTFRLYYHSLAACRVPRAVLWR